MFDNLFWALYWIDVFSMIGGNLAAATSILAFLAAFSGMWSAGERKKYPTKFLAVISSAVFSFTILLSLIPSKQTMYMMLGVKATKDFTQTEMGKKLELYINGQMDEFLNNKTGK